MSGGDRQELMLPRMAALPADALPKEDPNFAPEACPEPRLTVLLTWWRGWRPDYELVHVNAISRMIRHYLLLPHRLVLLTDQPAQGALVDEVRPCPADPPGLQTVRSVNCFRRLRFFDPAYAAQFGTEWIMSVDLDTLILADLTDCIRAAMQHPFGLWMLRGRWAARSPRERPYNGALMLLRTGAHAHCWQSFDPVLSPRAIVKARWVGSDQSWIGLTVPGAPTLGPEHGVYFFGQYLQARTMRHHTPARLLNYAGNVKPWSKPCRFKDRALWQEYQQWVDAA